MSSASATATSRPPVTVGDFPVMENRRSRKNKGGNSQTTVQSEAKTESFAQKQFTSLPKLQQALELHLGFLDTVKSLGSNSPNYSATLYSLNNKISELRNQINASEKEGAFIGSDPTHQITKRQQIKTILLKDYATASAETKKQIDNSLAEVCQRPSLPELKTKYISFQQQSQKIVALNQELGAELTEMEKWNPVWATKNMEQVNQTDLQRDVNILLENRKQLNLKISKFNEIVPNSFVELHRLIHLWESIFPAHKLTQDDTLFIRSAVSNYTTKEVEYSHYEETYACVQLLKALIPVFEKQSTDLNSNWNSTKDSLRYMSFIATEKRFPSRLYTGREEAGKDKYGVTSLHVAELDTKGNWKLDPNATGLFGYLWGTNTPKNEAAASSSSSK